MTRFLVISILLSATLCSAQAPPTCEPINNTSASPGYRGSAGNAPPGSVSKLPIRSLLYPGSNTRIYTRYMPWFGDPKHREIGYRSDDPQQVSRQVADMKSRGIQGAIVDWYGPNSGPKNHSTILLMQEAEHQDFQFGISVDAGALADCEKHDCDANSRLISLLTYVAQHFETSPAYIRFQDREAVFFFGLEKYSIDWKRVRRSLHAEPLLLFFRNSPTFANPDADGAYAWMAPETASPRDPMALQYLERFYTRAQPSDKIAMGSAYKGFNDSDASWGKGRVIDQQCGQTWLSTFALANRFYSSRNQLPALIIPTWNDYEEGTEIETGIDNCVSVKAEVNREKLSWTITGRDDTLDHISIFAKTDSRWIPLTDLPPTARSISLRELSSPAAIIALCVQAVAKPSLLNHSSGPIKMLPPKSDSH